MCDFRSSIRRAARVAVAVLVAVGLASCCNAAPVPVPTPESPCPAGCGFTVVETFPHKRDAFTQGLVYEDGFLYEGTGAVGGNSTLRKVEIATGNVVQSISLDSQYFGEGITIWQDKIIQLTWQSKVGFVYDKNTFEKVGQFEYPTEGWGLTHDGENLIMSDGTATLYFLDPGVFVETRIIQTVRDANGNPVTRLNELEYIDGLIYANVWQTDRIVIIAPDSGQVVGVIDLAGLLPVADRSPPVDVLNGIAYDATGDRLFVTGKFWPKLFHLDLVKNP